MLRIVRLSVLAAVVVMVLVGLLPAQSQTTFSLAATGDSIITRRVSAYTDTPFLNLVEILRGADAAFTNLEINLFNLSEFEGYPQAEDGGNWELGPPEAAHDLKWMGIDLFHRANNHATDYGVEGMIATSRLLDSLQLVHAGAGNNLGEASQARYFETNAGRVALISMATTFTPMSRAGEARSEIKGRPGINAVRVEHTYELASQDLERIRDVAAKLGGRTGRSADDPVRLAGTTYRPGPETRVRSEINSIDRDRVLRGIRSAAKQADFVVVSSHSHDPGNNSLKPPPYIEEFTRQCIDAGADMFIIHGPHQLRGVEIYKGKPVFYSLGNFVFQNETIEPMPHDMYERYGLGHDDLAGDLYDTRFQGDTTGFPSDSTWWESVVAVPLFENGNLVRIELHPLDLGFGRPRPQRGTPRLASGDLARKILERVVSLSEPYGTKISISGDVGVWTAPAP